VCSGYRQLAPLLLSRATEDAATYGVRLPSHLVVKWKLFPGAKEVLCPTACFADIEQL
jgi:hypothetical protein